MQLKLPNRKAAPSLGSSLTVEQKPKARPVNVVRNSVRDSEATFPQTEAETASVGLSIGLTIPGPEFSYMSARVDAWCILPCLPNDDAVRSAYAKASELVQERLEIESNEAKEFFASVKTKA